MTSLNSKIGPLFVWQALTLAVVLVMTGGLTYAGFELTDGGASGGLAEDEQLVPARVGDLINEVSTNGTIIFPLQEVARFVPAGTVSEALVEVGDTVREGQALAVLDASSIAALEKVVATARVTLRNAEETLADAVDTTPEELADAQAALNAATVDLASAVLGVTVAEDAGATDTANATTDAAAAVEAYGSVLAKWLGVEPAEAELATDPDTLLAAWGVDIDAVFAADQRSINAIRDVGDLPPDDPSTVWNETQVYTWLNLYPGDITGSCGDGIAPNQGSCVQLEIDAAWDALQAAETARDTAIVDSGKAIAKAEALVVTNTVALSAKQDALDIAVNGADTLDLGVLLADVNSAGLALEAALSDLEGATLVAPLTGVVATVDMESGDNARAAAVGIVVVDISVVEIEGSVDEIDVLSIRPGITAEVTMTALPGQTLSGTVTEIGAPTNQQGVVTFPIQVRLEVPAGVQLFEGLSATANIITSQQLGVLLVPTAAIQGSFIQPFVRVISTEGLEERPVELGASDDFWVVVNDGLVEGEQVAMPAPSAGDTGFGVFTFGGGGFGGNIDRQALRALQGRGGGGGGGGGRQ